MFWTTTTQLMVIGTAAFGISFSVIYTLIYCLKSRRKRGYEETEILRDELLGHKFATERSPSLTSPPSTQPILNPNYNASPLKIPTRHLRSTSASYSPTHYLSPHHRRNSTPTHPSCQNTCCPHHAEQHHHHHLSNPIKSISNASSSSSLASLASSATSISPNLNTRSLEHHHNKANTINQSYIKSTKPSTTTTTTKPIPSKLVSTTNSWDNQKSFSFGPIPARKSGRARNHKLSQLDEKQPLLMIGSSSQDQKPEKFALEEDDNTKESSLFEDNFFDFKSSEKKVNHPFNTNGIINLKRKHYTPDLFSKEHIVLEEIPYYTNVEDMSCNYNN